MTRLEQTLDGKELPKNVALYRDENTGALEVRFWRFHLGRAEGHLVRHAWGAVRGDLILGLS